MTWYYLSEQRGTKKAQSFRSMWPNLLPQVMQLERHKTPTFCNIA